MTMSTDTDVLEYLPDLYDYGIQDFSDEHEKSRQDIFRRLRVDWWPRHRGTRLDIKALGSEIEMREDRLTESQFTRAAVFHVLAYYILPKLMKFEPEGDRFSQMMTYYRSRWDEEFDMVLRDGVEYDRNDDGEITPNERATNNYLRLVR
jgi:hypothetical protein